MCAVEYLTGYVRVYAKFDMLSLIGYNRVCDRACEGAC